MTQKRKPTPTDVYVWLLGISHGNINLEIDHAAMAKAALELMKKLAEPHRALEKAKARA